MILNEIKNNMVISGTYSSGGYQYGHKNLELHQEINIVWVGTKTKQFAKLVVHVTHALIIIYEKLNY